MRPFTICAFQVPFSLFGQFLCAHMFRFVSCWAKRADLLTSELKKEDRRKMSLGVVRVHLSTTREYFYNTATVPDSHFTYTLFYLSKYFVLSQ